jgi:hypothetical protein
MYRLLHERHGGSQLLQREGDRPHGRQPAAPGSTTTPGCDPAARGTSSAPHTAGETPAADSRWGPCAVEGRPVAQKPANSKTAPKRMRCLLNLLVLSDDGASPAAARRHQLPLPTGAVLVWTPPGSAASSAATLLATVRANQGDRMNPTTIGIDLAKRVSEVAGANRNWRVPRWPMPSPWPRHVQAAAADLVARVHRSAQVSVVSVRRPGTAKP